MVLGAAWVQVVLSALLVVSDVAVEEEVVWHMLAMDKAHMPRKPRTNMLGMEVILMSSDHDEISHA